MQVAPASAAAAPGSEGDPGRPFAFTGAILAALVLHVAGGWWFAGPSLAGSSGESIRPVMHVRAVDAPAVVPRVDTPAVAVAEPADPTPTPAKAEAPTPIDARLPVVTAAQSPVATAPSAASQAAATDPHPTETKATVASAPAALPPAPDYLASGQLDPGPRPLDEVEPAYPAQAGLQEGTVVLRLLINASGTVDNVAVVRAYPPGLFDTSAMAAWAAARFEPGRFLGVPVKSQMLLEQKFVSTNRGSRISGRGY